MKVTIQIPTPLRTYTENRKQIEVKAESVGSALEQLVTKYERLRLQLYNGYKLRSYVNVYLNDEDIRYLELKENTKIVDGDTISIIPSIAGGIRD